MDDIFNYQSILLLNIILKFPITTTKELWKIRKVSKMKIEKIKYPETDYDDDMMVHFIDLELVMMLLTN